MFCGMLVKRIRNEPQDTRGHENKASPYAHGTCPETQRPAAHAVVLLVGAAFVERKRLVYNNDISFRSFTESLTGAIVYEVIAVLYYVHTTAIRRLSALGSHGPATQLGCKNTVCHRATLK